MNMELSQVRAAETKYVQQDYSAGDAGKDTASEGNANEDTVSISDGKADMEPPMYSPKGLALAFKPAKPPKPAKPAKPIKPPKPSKPPKPPKPGNGGGNGGGGGPING
jgi:hypothetical protein